MSSDRCRGEPRFSASGIHAEFKLFRAPKYFSGIVRFKPPLHAGGVCMIDKNSQKSVFWYFYSMKSDFWGMRLGCPSRRLGHVVAPGTDI
jgi:hypothetical protein